MKLTLDTVVNPENDTSFASQINSNFDAIETAIENTLSLDGTSPNSLEAELDMDDNKIINVATPTAAADAANKSYVDSVASSGVAGADGTDGTDGTDGDDGWSPIFSVASDSDRRVLKLESWTGGTGSTPGSEGYYVSASGLDATIGNGVDIRGPQGTSGAGTGDLLAANNLSDVNNASTSRTNLGLAIGSDVQAYDADLAAIAGLTSAADKLPYFTGSGTAGLADFTSAARSLLDDASVSAMRTTLGVAIGSNVQAYDAGLASIAGLTTSANKMLYTTGSDTYATTDLTSAGRALLDDADASAQRTTLGLTSLAVASFASQAEAEAGTSTTRAMSPARTADAIDALETVQKLSSGTFSDNAADIDLSSAGTYTYLVLVVTGLVMTVDGEDIYLRFSNDGGSTFESGSSYYAWTYRGYTADSLQVTQLTDGSSAIKLGEGIDSGTSGGMSGEFKIYNAASGTLKTTLMGDNVGFKSDGDMIRSYIGGTNNTAEVNDYLRVLASGDTIASGSWALYGVL